MNLRHLTLLTLLAPTLVSAEAPSGRLVDNVAFDNKLYELVGAMHNLEISCRLASEDYAESPEKCLSGVPANLSSKIKSLSVVMASSRELETKDSKRNSLRNTLNKYAAQLLDSANIFSEGFIKASKANAWTEEADTLVYKSADVFRSYLIADPAKAMRDFISDDLEFRQRCPETLSLNLGLSEDKSDFSLGAMLYSDNRTLLALVTPGQLAYALGFRSGDTFKTISGKTIENVIQFKATLKSQQGKSVTVEVIRDGKSKALTIDLPSDLSRFDEDPEATAAAKEFFSTILEGKIDRKRLSVACNERLSVEREQQIKEFLAQFGALQKFEFVKGRSDINHSVRTYEATLGTTKHILTLTINDDLITNVEIGN